MSDLRGQQLKDSYQNLVTRGTDNKLENGNGVEFADLDDKASLSGGSDADFDAMPQVDGIPIVERGSNSDGEFVRFADGTQICIAIHPIEFNGNVGLSSRQSFNMPQSMQGTPYFGSVTVAETLSGSGRDFAQGLLYMAEDTQWQVATESQVTADVRSVDCSFISIGRWY